MNIQQSNERSALSSIFIIIGLVLVGMVVGNIFAAIVMVLVSGIDLHDFANLNQSIMASPTGWLSMILGQGVAAIFTFIATAWLYWTVIEKKNMSELNFKTLPTPVIFILVIAAQFIFMPFNGWLQAINENMVLPASLKGLEDFMKSMEDSLADVTKFLTTFNSFGEYLLALVVIAVIAGIGEELIFRGLIQRKLFLGTKNIHVAIWGAAFIFSFIHFQFYGFLPRMFLGALFGYLYFWTGNLWIPIAAHIFNNAFAVTIMYLIHLGKVSPEVENMDTLPVPFTIISFIMGISMLLIIKRKTE